MKIIAITVAVVLSACQTSPDYLLRSAFPNIGFTESDAMRLTVHDVQQIVAIAAPRSEILKPITSITLLGPDAAAVIAGQVEGTAGTITEFNVRKVEGHWKIVDSSVHRENVVVTY